MTALQISDSIACIILAAGDSTRMGRTKALLHYRGKTFIEKLIDDYRTVGCHPIIVILGKDADQVNTLLEGSDLEVQINPHPENGLLSSLQIGLKSLPANCAGAFFSPVDHPAVRIETLQMMLKEWGRRGEKAVRPRFRGRGGHPALLGRGWIEEVPTLPLSSSVRTLLHQRSSDIIEFPVSDPGILIDVDTPEDYQRLLYADSKQE